MSTGSGVDGRPRMIDVGRMASVSAQTVSRYFNGGYVAPGTRERIENAVEALDYRPHAAARQLRSNRTEALGVIAMGSPNFGVWSLLEGMTAGARQAGFTLVIGQLDISSNRPDAASEVEAAVDHLLRSGVDGIIVASPYAGGEDLLADLVTGVPLVIMTGRLGSPDNSVLVDSYGAGTLAMEHLIALGHQRILHLSGDPTTIESEQRRASYYDSLARLGLPALQDIGRDWTAESGFDIGWSVDPKDFTAVFAANDAIASGFMSAMRDRGLEAPTDFSIVGIDNMPETQFYAPPLTTVTLDFVGIGEAAVEMMLRRIRERRSLPQQTVPPHLEERRSTSSPSS